MPVTCRICASPSTILRARPQPWTFYECGECGVLWVEPMPSGAAIGDADAVYTATYYAGDPRDDEPAHAALAVEVAGRRLGRIEADLGRTGTILDVGCGTGVLLGVAAARGWNAIGVEVSATAAQAARAQPGVAVHTGTLDEAPIEPGSIDVAVLSHVLEHVPDPVALLRSVRRLVRDDGLVVLALPNARGLIHGATNLAHRARGRYGKDRFACSLYPPAHLYAFDAASLVRALSRGGLVATSILVTGKGDPRTYPMRTWRGAGRWWPAQRAIEWLGRRIGRGSLLEAHARPLAGADPGAPGGS